MYRYVVNKGWKQILRIRWIYSHCRRICRRSSASSSSCFHLGASDSSAPEQYWSLIVEWILASNSQEKFITFGESRRTKRQGRHHPSQSNFLMQFLAKFMPNNRLGPPLGCRSLGNSGSAPNNMYTWSKHSLSLVTPSLKKGAPICSVQCPWWLWLLACFWTVIKTHTYSQIHWISKPKRAWGYSGQLWFITPPSHPLPHHTSGWQSRNNWRFCWPKSEAENIASRDWKTDFKYISLLFLWKTKIALAMELDIWYRRMHSFRMRTARLLTVFCGIPLGGLVGQTLSWRLEARSHGKCRRQRVNRLFILLFTA